MKFALVVAVSTLGVGFAPSAMAFPPAGISRAASSTEGCGNPLWHTAYRPGTPIACCNHAFGCAQFLATTRVQPEHRTPST